MSLPIRVAFSFFIFLVLYVYLGYPLLLLILSKVRRAPPVAKADITPSVSLIIPAYNEESAIARKIENSLALDYPMDRLEIIVASDGSTDRTTEIVQRYRARGVKLVALDSNGGKSAVQNAGVAQAAGDVLFFTDANVTIHSDAVRKVVQNFAGEQVGCVVGRVTYLNEGDTSVSEGEGFYWRYELFVRGRESEVGNFAVGSGPIMAVRRPLFEALDPNVGEDLVLPIRVALAGNRVVYEPEAISEELLFQNAPGNMFTSKVRIISKDLRGLLLCRAILNPFRYPLYAWGLVSHKLLRWLVPYFLIAIFGLNLVLLGGPIYNVLLGLQGAFYALAAIGCLWPRKRKAPLILGVPFSFCLVNLAALVGVARFIVGKRSARWEPVR